ncbi:hypothetical protein ONZ43_g7069 [Nemania bipapillata]|uniref:Uncharacterized protein n=1 Tax=Nemania bipapillata TaxID=110536 RepID=A0ACC2HUK0_9PEZI|nr:hypothetical protein ONZ43_g7069 [Nemania bipapillata]
MAENGNASVPNSQLGECPPLLVKKLSDKAQLPTRGSTFAAGYDMYSSQAATVPARGKVLVDTDISIALPAGTYVMKKKQTDALLPAPVSHPSTPSRQARALSMPTTAAK